VRPDDEYAQSNLGKHIGLGEHIQFGRTHRFAPTCGDTMV
jgi:hypothetical protein